MQCLLVCVIITGIVIVIIIIINTNIVIVMIKTIIIIIIIIIIITISSVSGDNGNNYTYIREATRFLGIVQMIKSSCKCIYLFLFYLLALSIA